LGVLGLGRIGRQVAQRALGLGMDVVAYDPFVAAERFRDLGIDPAASLDSSPRSTRAKSPERLSTSSTSSRTPGRCSSFRRSS
jgi:phosphoglycerate dehydrogenase-like enzyme